MNVSKFVVTPLLLVLAAPLAVFAQGASAIQVNHITIPYHGDPALVDSQSAARLSIPTWKSSIVVGGKTYPYRMIGADPSIVVKNNSISIPTPVIPVVLVFSDGTVFDPTAADPTCSPAGTAKDLTLASPVFANRAWQPGGTSVGNVQYIDFFQRANFWKYTQPTGVNPNYHLTFNPSVTFSLQITVPKAFGYTQSGGWCGKIGIMDIVWFDNHVQKTIIPMLAASGVDPTTLPVFLFYNVVMAFAPITNPSNCCILGYHSAYSNPAFGNHFQAYMVSEHDSTGAFGKGNEDVSTLTHELGETVDDPTGLNPTPPWGNIGQVAGCQANLEVGDPLSNTVLSIVMPNGFKYHVQELAFFSWFFGQTPSIGLNGWYSSNGSFKTPAAPCGPSAK